MQVQLDEEIWQVSDNVQLGEVLANLSDRAQSKGCLVTELMVGNRKMTDRELVPPTLARMASSFGSIAAVSKPLENIMQYSQGTGKKFGKQLGLQSQKLADDFRRGHGSFRQIDQWFGQMADYLEWLQIHETVGFTKCEGTRDLSFWVNELMTARKNQDGVRIADILEYEVSSLLSQSLASPK